MLAGRETTRPWSLTRILLSRLGLPVRLVANKSVDELGRLLRIRSVVVLWIRWAPAAGKEAPVELGALRLRRPYGMAYLRLSHAIGWQLVTYPMHNSRLAYTSCVQGSLIRNGGCGKTGNRGVERQHGGSPRG